MPYNAGKKGKLNQPSSTLDAAGAQGYYGVKDVFLYGKAGEYPGSVQPEGIITYGGLEYKLSGTTGFKQNNSGFSTFTVSVNSVTADIKLWGAGGGAKKGNEGNTNYGAGAAGGLTQARVTLPIGDYAILVGQGGLGGSQGANNGARRFPDGGKCTEFARSDGGGGGGGSTRLGVISNGGITLSDSSTFDTTASFNNSNYNGYIAIAGGGAGSTRYATTDYSASTDDPDFGRGGGLLGGNGSIAYPSEGPDAMGHGGTQSAGGAVGTGGRLDYSPTAGQKYSGGDGAAGGGGGYYGGGGSQGYYAQAGAGSGYLDSSYCVAGQPNSTIINGGNAPDTKHDNITADGTYTTAGEGGNISANANGNDGLFTLTVIS